MDIRTGQTFETFEDAEAAGVPASDIANLHGREVRFTSGPFKNRVYRRTPAWQLVRVSLKRGDVTESDGAGNVVRV